MIMQRSLNLAAVVALSLCGLGGCEDDPVSSLRRELDVTVATDRSRYSIATDGVARVTLTNRSTHDVYLRMDVYVVVERLRNLAWRDAIAWFIVDGIGRSFPVVPGDTHSDELNLRFFLPDQPGTY